VRHAHGRCLAKAPFFHQRRYNFSSYPEIAAHTHPQHPWLQGAPVTTPGLRVARVSTGPCRQREWLVTMRDDDTPRATTCYNSTRSKATNRSILGRVGPQMVARREQRTLCPVLPRVARTPCAVSQCEPTSSSTLGKQTGQARTRTSSLTTERRRLAKRSAQWLSDRYSRSECATCWGLAPPAGQAHSLKFRDPRVRLRTVTHSTSREPGVFPMFALAQLADPRVRAQVTNCSREGGPKGFCRSDGGDRRPSQAKRSASPPEQP
jgi:hypothetical protein